MQFGTFKRADELLMSSLSGYEYRVHYIRVHECSGRVCLMKNITLSADEGLIEAARERARAEHTTLNEQFRLWLADYARREQQAERAMETIRELRGKLRTSDES